MRWLILLSTFFFFEGYGQTFEELVEMGYQNYQLGEYEQAIQYFDKAAAKQEDDPELFYLRGVCKSQAGLNSEALGDYDIALSLDPGYAEVHYEKGYALFLLLQLEESIKSFDKAIELKPKYAEAWFTRGSIKCIQGDAKGAEEDWDQARTLGAYIPEQKCE